MLLFIFIMFAYFRCSPLRASSPSSTIGALSSSSCFPPSGSCHFVHSSSLQLPGICLHPEFPLLPSCDISPGRALDLCSSPFIWSQYLLSHEVFHSLYQKEVFLHVQGILFLFLIAFIHPVFYGILSS